MLEINAPYLDTGPETHIDWHTRLAARMASVMDKMADYVEFTGEGGNGKSVLQEVHQQIDRRIAKYPTYS
jgi:hypothetical protein